MEGKDGSGPDRVAKGEADEGGEIINIHRVPLVGLEHADIKVEEIPPDFVFPEPPRPEAGRLEPPAKAATPTTGMVLLLSLSAALAGGALLVTAAWLGRCSRSRRQSFLRRVLQLYDATERALEEERSDRGAHQGSSSSNGSVRSLSGSSCGSFGSRAQEAKRQLDTLQELIEEGLDISKSFRWEAARRGGTESRRLRECVQGLSRRRSKVERAAEELRVMAEMERLLTRLDSGGGGVLDGAGLSTGRDCDGALEDESDSDASDSDERPARLATRAAALLYDDSDIAATRYAPSCVFREELKRWCDRLSEKEQDAVDWLKLGLQRWDLEMVDRALAQLRVLELRKIVKDFKKKREDVRSKRWRLQQDLKTAKDQAGNGNHSSLRKACVKAETFSATDLDEYQSAKQCLRNALAAKLETKARRILSVNGILPDTRCNVRLDLTSGPALLMRDDLTDAGLASSGGGSSGLFNGADPCNSATAGPRVARQLPLHPEGEHGEPFHPHDAAACGVSGGDLMSGAHSHGSSLAQGGGAVGGCDTVEHPSRTAGVAGVGALGNSRIVPWGQPPGRNGAGAGETQISQHYARELVEVRRKAESEFMVCVEKQEDEHTRARDKDQAAVEAQDAKETHRQEYIARLDTRNVQEGERLALEIQRLVKEEQDKEERKRRADADADTNHLKQLWSSDGNFLWLLSAVDVAIAAVTFARKKGFSLDPGVVFNAAWGLVVAECAEGGRGGAGTAAGASGAAPPLCTSSAAVGASSSSPASGSGLGGGLAGYGGVCGDAVGVWSEAAATGSTGEIGESTLWWAWSTAGSTAGAVIRAGYASAGWLLGQTLGLVSPNVQCEVRVVLSLVGWLLSLGLVMFLVGGLLGPGSGGVRAAKWVLLAAWVWGRFHDWVLHASQELVLFFAPVPALVLAYGRVLRYFERHRKPDGFWWVYGWDVRFFWSRALPAVVSGVLACFLGAQVS